MLSRNKSKNTRRSSNKSLPKIRKTSFALLFVVAFAVFGSVTLWRSYAAPNAGIFNVHCKFTGSNRMDDPIVKPGQPGASHMHAFFGNKSTNAFSTLSTLSASDTTCQRKVDKSAYWVPQMYFNGAAVNPSLVQAYYTSEIGHVDVVPPSGMELVAGSAGSTKAQSKDIVKWTCAGGTVKGTTSDSVPTCPELPDEPDGLKLIVFFQNCWNEQITYGQNTSANTTYAVDGKCPTGYKSIPQLRLEVKYPKGYDGRGEITFASGSKHTFHADWFNAWDPGNLESIVANCINVDKNCGNTIPAFSPPPTTPTTPTTPTPGDNCQSTQIEEESRISRFKKNFLSRISEII